jgi:hypothetical protein
MEADATASVYSDIEAKVVPVFKAKWTLPADLNL